MRNAFGPRMRRNALPVVSALALAMMTAGCSLVDMPSNQALAKQPSAPASTPSAGRTAAPAKPELDVSQAERQSANAHTVSASFTERISGPARVTLSGQVQAQSSPLRIAEQLDVSGGGPSGQVSAVVTRRAIYAETSSEPGSWIKLALPRIDRTALLPELRNADPTVQIRMLLAASHARFTGHQTVEGVVTSRYVASIAPSVALAGLPTALRADVAPYVSLIKGDIHYVIWIEPGDHLKQFRLTERALGARITVTETINWVNQPLHIAIPHATAVPSQLGGVFSSL
jgi:hypothetical protein